MVPAQQGIIVQLALLQQHRMCAVLESIVQQGVQAQQIALLGTMEARQQTVLSYATANALQGIIALLEALLQLAQDNALPDIIALPGLAAQRRMYVEQGITALLEVQE